MSLTGDFHDLPDGRVRLDLSDGSFTILSGRDQDAHVLMQQTANGTVFSDFHGNDPGHVHFPDGTSGDYHYLADGRVELDMNDGSSTLMSGTGPDAHVLSQTTANGDVYSGFDAQGHPSHVVFHG